MKRHLNGRKKYMARQGPQEILKVKRPTKEEFSKRKRLSFEQGLLNELQET